MKRISKMGISQKRQGASWQHLIVPGIIVQSLLIGGGFATGREIVEYGAKFGREGMWSGLTIFLGFTLMSYFSFEFARQTQSFNYRTFFKKLIGPFWVLFDLIYIVLGIIIIAVMASATGEIFKSTLNLNYWFGVGLVAILVAFLNYKGELIIVKFKTLGTIFLFIAYLVFALLVLINHGDKVIENLVAPRQERSLVSVIWTGILYVGYNLTVYPASFFTIRALTTTKDIFKASMITGFMMCIPWFLTFFSLMAYYPDEKVMGATVPWLEMLGGFSTFIIVFYGLVVGWTLIETATGIIHAFVARLDNHYMEIRNKSLSKGAKSRVALIALVLAVVLAQFGIIDLIAIGYSAMAYGMIAIFALPMVIWGIRSMISK